MELGLRLGCNGAVPKPFSFLDHHSTDTVKMATDLGFCMALGTENTRSDDDEIRRVCSSEEAPVQLDLLPFSPVPRAHHLPWLNHQKLMPDRGSSDGIATTGRSGLPAVEEGDDGAAVSSPNSTTVSSFQMDFPVRNGNNNNNHKRDMDQLGLSDEDDNALTRKKLRLSKDQSAFLEQSFTEHTTLNPKQKLALAKQLNLRPRQVEVWFQNRRARTKLKQTEVDCEYLKKCCEKLSEENRRLHKELQELRALKTSQPFYNQLPATTLTMCPSCERVATTTTTSSATATAVTTPSTTGTTNTISSSSSSAVALSIVKPRSMFPLFSHSQPQAQAH